MQAELEKLVNGFGESPLISGKQMRELLESDREGFRSAAIPLLKNISNERGCRYLVTLLWTNDMLMHALCDGSALRLEEAVSLARAAAKVDPQLHIRLLRHLLEGIETGAETVDDSSASRLLEIVSAISEGAGILPMLSQLLRHPNARIRSKAALLIGRSNKSAKWLEKRMAEADPRVRANAIEALWGINGEQSRAILWEAAKDKHNRVAGNALVGLYRSGDVTSIPAFLEMAESEEPLFRLTGVWAMGETEDPRFLPVLGRRLADAQGALRKTVFHAINRIKSALSHTSALPSLRVTILHANCTPDLMRLRVIVGDTESQPVMQLPATRFVIWDEGVPIARYSVEEHCKRDPLCVGFALPRRIELTDSFRRICQEALLGCLDNKRKPDLWCVMKYVEITTRIGSHDTASGRLFGQDMSEAAPAASLEPPAPANFSADSPVLRTRIESAGVRHELAHGIVSATERLLEGIASARGLRHLILLQEHSAAVEANAVRQITSTAQQARVAVHAVSLSADDALREICLETGGVFRHLEEPASLPGALENLYRSLLFRYELQYTPELIAKRQPNFSLRLQVLTQEGQGEACAHVS